MFQGLTLNPTDFRDILTKGKDFVKSKITDDQYHRETNSFNTSFVYSISQALNK